jgi:transposase
MTKRSTTPTFPLYVGIDVSMNTFDVSIITDAQERVNLRRSVFDNTPSGCAALVSEIVRAVTEYEADSVLVGYEATGNYAFHLPFAISGDKRLAKVKPEIYRINPKIIANFRKSYNVLPKTDAVDSMLIAERLRLKKLPPYRQFNPKYHALRALTRTRFSIAQKLGAEKMRFIRKKYREVTKHQHKRAVVFTARKLVRVLFALLKKNKLYVSPNRPAAK